MRTLLAVLCCAVCFSVQPVRAQSAPDDQAWKNKMNQMYSLLSELLMDTSMGERFNDPDNRSRITANAKRLSEIAKEMDVALKGGKGKAKIQISDKDPSLPMIMDLFYDQTEEAYSALQSGNRDYARGLLRNVTGYCISCHTRSGTGPESSLPKPDGFGKLTAMQKAEFFAASRQFDAALDELKTVIDDGDYAKANPFQWEKAVRYALAIAIRVKNDPAQAKKLTEKVMDSKTAPAFLKGNAKKWKVAVEAWQKESKTTIPKKKDALMREAVRLIGQAKKLQNYPSDRAGDIYYLRASSRLHEMMSLAPKGKELAEALYLAGLSYESLSYLNFWALPDLYYESCIKKAPHTSLSQECYRQLEENTYVGYSGSAGTDIPFAVRDHLNHLQQMATPAGVSPEKDLH
ncbi:hypothetical protein K2X30_00010 [bacterium]|nr:hypothetical protein [bacterium]